MSARILHAVQAPDRRHIVATPTDGACAIISQTAGSQSCESLHLSWLDVALDLLKRHSGMVWDPGRFRGIAPRRGCEDIWEPCGRTLRRPHALAMPGENQLTIFFFQRNRKKMTKKLTDRRVLICFCRGPIQK